MSLNVLHAFVAKYWFPQDEHGEHMVFALALQLIDMNCDDEHEAQVEHCVLLEYVQVLEMYCVDEHIAQLEQMRFEVELHSLTTY